MTIQQFLMMNEMEKLSIIMESGILIVRDQDGETRRFLYSFESFFVTAVYRLSDDQLLEISSFTGLDFALTGARRLLVSVNPAEREYATPDI